MTKEEKPKGKRRSVGAKSKATSKSRDGDRFIDSDGTRSEDAHTKIGCVLIVLGVFGVGLVCILAFSFIEYIRLDEDALSVEEADGQEASSAESPAEFDVLTSLTASAFNLSRIFTEQESNSWNSIVQSVIYMNEPDQQQPAILLWIPLPNATSTLQCIVARVIKACFPARSRHVERKRVIDSSSFASVQSQQAKVTLDRQLEAVLGDSLVTVPAVLLKNIDMLPPAAAILFHKYCDHEWAWRPESIILLTLREEVPYADISSVYELLHRRWISESDSVDEAQVDAILARILEWPIFVAKETDSVLQQHC